jgi:hydrogenase-4 component F
MTLLDSLVAVPWAGALLLLAIGAARWAALANIAVSAVTCLLAFALPGRGYGLEGMLHLDNLNQPLLLLAGFVGLTTALYAAATLHAKGFDGRARRQYHAAFQVFCGAGNLALLSDNLGLMWVAIEIATLASVLMVAIDRSPAAIEAAWKFFLLCGVGIALALFGTIVLALAARPLVGGEAEMLSFTALRLVAGRADAGLLSVGFVFLLVGYGTKAGLVPLHAWLPDAHAEGPTAISAVLSGLLLNAAMHAVLRAKYILEQNAGVIEPGPFLIALGLASLLLAAFSLWRRQDARRFFAWSSIEHMGIAAIAFGIGGPLASAAGLLHMIGHSLIKSAIFFAIGRAVILKGSQKLADLGGLVTGHPRLGWGLMLAGLGIAGLPPFALFASEFRILAEAAAHLPLLALPLGLGLVVALAALLATLQGLCFGPPTPDAPQPLGAILGSWAMALPLWLHLAAAMAAPALLAWSLAQ